MRMNHSLKVANAILAMVEVLRPDQAQNLYLEPYMNCREQGWALTVLTDNFEQDKKAVFAECRSSDQIVVYHGYRNDFRQGNVPVDRVYNTQACYFDEGKIKEAAEAVVAYLLG